MALQNAPLGEASEGVTQRPMEKKVFQMEDV